MVMQTKLDGHQTSFLSLSERTGSIASHRRKGGVAALVDCSIPPGTASLTASHEFFTKNMNISGNWCTNAFRCRLGSRLSERPSVVSFSGFIIQLLLDSEACRDRGCCRNALLALKQRCSSKTYEMGACFGESSKFHFSSWLFRLFLCFDAYAGIEVAVFC